MIQRLLTLLGWGLLVASLFYLGVVLSAHFTLLLKLVFSWTTVAVTMTSSVAYAVSLLLHAKAWGLLVSMVDKANAPFAQVLSVYGRAQIAKYLPGNVFHYAGRQVFGIKMGWSHTAMAAASILETGLVLSAAATLTLIAGLLGSTAVFSLVPAPLLVVVAAGLVLAPWTWLWLAPRVSVLKEVPFLGDLSSSIRSSTLAACTGLYLLFFGIFASLGWILWSGLSNFWSIELLPVIGSAIVASWLAGYITPAAPAGAGVREAAMVFLLASTFGEGDVLALALVLRVVTTIGDFLHFLIALIVPRKIFLQAAVGEGKIG